MEGYADDLALFFRQKENSAVIITEVITRQIAAIQVYMNSAPPAERPPEPILSTHHWGSPS